MGTAFGNPFIGNVHDLVTAFNGGKPVCNDKGGSAFEQLVERSLELTFSFGVDGGGCLIQNQDFGVCKQGTCKGNQLFLSL